MSEERDFLARWSRRKVEARHEPVAEPEPAPEPVPAEPDARSDVEVLEELGLPDPDTLGPGADFRAFLAEAVPDHLRRRALRRLWTSNPVLANLDQLVDYGEDYTDAATVVENLQSAYKAGRGYLQRVAEAGEGTEAAQAEAPAGPPEATEAEPEQTAAQAAPGQGEAEQAEAPEAPSDQPERPMSAAVLRDSDLRESSTSSGDPDEARAASPEEAPRASSSSRRRMRFSFDPG